MNHDARPTDLENRVIAALPQTSPNDEFNRELVGHVHPEGWLNPTPTGRYNLVVIGAGTAGLVTAAGAAGLGAKVALIERDLMGGDCLNVGCVPSKAIIQAARTAAHVRNAHRFGVNVPEGTQVDFEAVMQRMRKLRAKISPNDSAARFRSLGVDVYFGQASFVDSETVDVNGTRLRFKHAVIATGTRASIPSIDGLERVRYLTNETLFSLTKLPKRLGVIGAGPIGCEMAQAFAELGSEVMLVASDDGLLPRDDRDAARIVHQAFIADGIQILGGGHGLQIDCPETIRLRSHASGASYEHHVEQLLVATGRKANVEGMNLAAVGVDFEPSGIKVDDYLRTTNAKIFAAGDVCGHYQFTHAADFMARLVIQNALFKGRKRVSDLVVPWSTYTSPEVAHVGLTIHQAQEQGTEIDTYTQHFSDVDRAILEGDEDGFVKVHTAKGTDRLVGATIVAKHAGDLISEITMAMSSGIGLSQIASVIHPYPTQADAIRKLGDQFNRTRLTPLVKTLMQKWLAWTR